ncbi:Septal ring factor EnvC, activator of murein hydrolases AmiA and AmiB [Blastococcus aggregatus]|uniref:Septal ring factor EnvC, activator of murein hydrolases AmiA and AmiB n=1 Tax=Blastococcus aggregatus TaxID=38502 RepID=A0A285VA19_9ACTN|nr:Septal ring factor EnvC, activator of murein hydrolases AmiA and AmiB [Blastococcus aggregatus]
MRPNPSANSVGGREEWRTVALATRHNRTTTISPRRRVGLTLATTALLTAALLGAPVALAAPADDARVEAARTQHDAVAAEIAALGARVAEAEQNLQRMTLEAEAASGNALAAQAALDVANQEAWLAAVALAEAEQAVEKAEDDVAEIGRHAYMGGGQKSSFGDVTLLLEAEGPAELLQQAATLDVLGAHRAETLGVMETVQVQQARAEQAAQASVAERDRAAGEAAAAHAAAEAQLSGAQAEFDTLALERLGLAEQLRAAEIRLLEMQGARDAAVAWEAQQAAREAAAAAANAVTTTAVPSGRASRGGSGTLASAGGATAPANGRVTSCYGTRWGTLHAGVDIAAPIGTPVFAPEGGVVLQAGPASGFGLAVAVQHRDGTITLYGHVNQFFVSPGQTVAAGEQIAEVGNRGQSTGPHLHFEVHEGGLYANRVNPVPWLSQRGISLGSC